jgi:hypothetical protein
MLECNKGHLWITLLGEKALHCAASRVGRTRRPIEVKDYGAKEKVIVDEGAFVVA